MSLYLISPPKGPPQTLQIAKHKLSGCNGISSKDKFGALEEQVLQIFLKSHLKKRSNKCQLPK